jgi:predicted amidophosphoribosyltransferase
VKFHRESFHLNLIDISVLNIRVLSPLKELLFPVHCYGCKALGLEICSVCRKFWNPHLYQQTIKNLTVYSSIKYSPIAKSILLSAKESGVKRADEMITSALCNLMKRIPTQHMRNPILVPIPGSKRAIRKRGRNFIFDIATALSSRTGIPVFNGMKINRSLLDQSRLSAIDRSRNISNAFELIEPIPNRDLVWLKASEIFLVDDLVTTGSTLLEAKRALNMRGIKVNLAITACMAETLNIGA